MASCAAGKTFRVYGQYTSLVCKLMIKTWGHIFEANEKKNTKNTCEPSKNLTPFLVDFATIYTYIYLTENGTQRTFT